MKINTKKTLGKVYVREDKKIGCVRISKNGSTNLSKSLGFKVWKEYDACRDFKIYSSIRNPIDRLISSYPETIKRFALVPNKFRDVYVNEEIFEDLLKLQIDRPELSFKYFLETLIKYGWYDAHQEPQINFLYDSSGVLMSSVKLFLLEDMTKSLQSIASEYAINLDDRSYNARIVEPKIKMNDFLTDLKSEFSFVKYEENHPLIKICKKNKYFKMNCYVSRKKSEFALREFYRKLLKSDEIRAMAKEFIQKYMEDDLKIYNKLVEKRQNGFIEVQRLFD